MRLHLVWIVLALIWSAPALAQKAPVACVKAAEMRAAGLRSIEASCTGTSVDALSCYNAGRFLQRSLASLDRLYGKDLAKCPDAERAGLEAALRRGRNVTTLMAREAYAALHAQLAEDHASHLAYATLKMYACMYFMNSSASGQQNPSDVVRATAVGPDGDESKPWAGVLAQLRGKPETGGKDSSETRFANEKFDDVCGRVIFSNPDGRLTKAFGEAYLETAEKMRSIAFQLADTFLPGGKARDPQVAVELEGVVAEFRRKAGDEIARLNVAHEERPGVANRREAIVAKGPNMEILEHRYAEVWKIYAGFLTWLEGTVGN